MVHRLRPALYRGRGNRRSGTTRRAAVRIHLGPTYRNRSVTLYAIPNGGGRRRVLVSERSTGEGNLTAKVLDERSNTTFLASFEGDARYARRQVLGRRQLSGLRPSLTLGGGYGQLGQIPAATDPINR